MIFRQFIHYDTYTLTYLLADQDTGEAIIIDPVREEADHYLTLFEQLDLKLLYSLDTHVHADHITASAKLREHTGCKTVLSRFSPAPCVDIKAEQDTKISFGKHSLTTLETPGHTDDSLCFLLTENDKNLVFTGDTLFIRGTGRTDFQNGNAAAQYESIFGKLLTLPEETVVYPGHDYNGNLSSTIGEEARFNPRLQVKSKAEYVELMANLDLPAPKYMDVAVPANLKCGNLN